MRNRLKTPIQLTFLAILFTLGLIISSIGVTLCRYEVKKAQNVNYVVKGLDELHFETQRNEWILNPNTGLLELNFAVSNRNPETNTISIANNTFYIRWLSTIDTTITLPVYTESGRVNIYTSTKELCEDQETYLYRFLDKNGEEIAFHIQGRTYGKQDFSLQIPRVNDAFLSELLIIDEAYELEAKRTYMSSQFYPLEVTSNFLNEDGNIIVNFEDTIDISLTTSHVIRSKISAVSNHDDIVIELKEKIEDNLPTEGEETETEPEEAVEIEENVHENELELMQEANKEKVVTLSVLPTYKEEDITILVEWQLINTDTEVEKTYKANFIIPAKKSINTNKPTEIKMEFVEENKNNFSKYEPMEFIITSPIDTIIQLKESIIFKYTRYSFDKGSNWYILAKDGGIEVPLKENQPQHILIDFSQSNIEWLNQVYEISAYHSYEKLAKLDFNMQIAEEKEIFKIIRSKTGIINYQPIEFSVNQEEPSIVIERLTDNGYEVIDESLFFEIRTVNKFDYQIYKKDNVKLSVGTYQVRITNKSNEEARFAFFVVEEKQEEETNPETTEQMEGEL